MSVTVAAFASSYQGRLDRSRRHHCARCIRVAAWSLSQRVGQAVADIDVQIRRFLLTQPTRGRNLLNRLRALENFAGFTTSAVEGIEFSLVSAMVAPQADMGMIATTRAPLKNPALR
jgi:hypothetical protein